MPKSLDEVLHEIWSNPATKQRLESDPKAFLQEHGIQVPANVKVELHEDSYNTMNFVLPEKLEGIPAETQDPVGKVVQRALQDPSFKAELLKDPKAAVSRTGESLPDGVDLKVYQNSPTTWHVILPVNPSQSELSDSDLEAVSGGFLKLAAAAARVVATRVVTGEIQNQYNMSQQQQQGQEMPKSGK